MKLQDALKKTGTAEAYANGLTFVVEDDQIDYSPTEPDGEPVNPDDDCSLTVQVGQMPPHYTGFFANADEIVEHLREHHPNLDWTPVEEEGE